MTSLPLPSHLHGSELAIIGMSGRFPRAKDLEAFWKNLREGLDCVTFFSDEELRSAGVGDALIRNPNYVKARMRLEDADLFDAGFFGYTPKEAAIMDPQHRLFLECSYLALENAGYASENYGGQIGIFAGAGSSHYLSRQVLPNTDVVEEMGAIQIAICNEPDSLASKVSYKLNLRGPSLVVQTFCSTSLVTVHLACQSLLNYECDLAMAGGVSVDSSQNTGYLYEAGGIASPDGHCRTFDAQAGGSIFGSGIGVVVLKRLKEAVADRDHVYAIIKGSAINNDGLLKAGYTAPGVAGQSSVIVEALANAGVEPETVSYIETHGTGTPLGDSVEIAALTKAFRCSTDKKQFCALGSVKPNIGHLDRAAGVANLIKATLALTNKELPPSLHVKKPNPDIDFPNSPFYVSTALTSWAPRSFPRRAGVSSFGLGGANAHVVLEEWENPSSEPSKRPFQLLTLSTTSESALDQATLQLAEHLAKNPDVNLADAAFTLQLGRRSFNSRRTVVCSSVEDAISSLQSLDPSRVRSAERSQDHNQAVFVFPGVGDHFEGMGAELYEHELVFRQEVQSCAAILEPHLGLNLCEVLYPKDGTRAEKESTPTKGPGAKVIDFRALVRGAVPQRAGTLHQTMYAQPAVFVVNYALARLLMSWGIVPRAMIGYSLGEYVAATIAGSISVADALYLVSSRAKMIDNLPHGAMLVVPLARKDVEEMMDSSLSVAITNGPYATVVAGPVQAVDSLQKVLAERELVSRKLDTTHAFHSKMMDPACPQFAECLANIRMRPPEVPYISNVTGDWIKDSEAVDPQYWIRHMCQTVQFDKGIETLLREGKFAYLEVGPGKSLSSFIVQHPEYGGTSERPVIPLMRNSYEQQSDCEVLLGALGKLWLLGLEIDWTKLYSGEQRRRISLPGYPFQRQRYWLDSGKVVTDSLTEHCGEGKRDDIGKWFYQPVWKEFPAWRSSDAESLKGDTSIWLLLMDNLGCGAALANTLEDFSCKTIRVLRGNSYERIGDGVYTVSPSDTADYKRLLKDFPKQQLRIIHLWSLETLHGSGHPLERFAQAQEIGFYSLMALSKALAQRSQETTIWAVTSNIHGLSGEESPEKATILGACRVIPQEQPNISCQAVDLGWPPRQSWQLNWICEQLAAECAQVVRSNQRGDTLVAYRDSRRWRQVYEPIVLEPVQQSALRIGGAYLITGGLGNVGMTIAQHFARSVQARIILTTRRAFPEKACWPEWLASHDTDDKISQFVRQFLEWESWGAIINVVEADTGDRDQMALAVEQFGELHGVIHAAGVSDEELFRSMQELLPSDCEGHFRAKAHGLYVLETVLAGKSLDFCVLFSSISSVLGGLGFGAYTAANIFMDHFVRRHNANEQQRWVSVNWDTWQLRDLPGWGVGATVAQFAMRAEEALEVLDRVMGNRPIDQLVNSTGDLQARIEKWVYLTSTETSVPKQARTRPQSMGRYMAPSNKLERIVAETWQNFLGIDAIGTHDNFFELGGNSLMAMQIIARLKKISGLDLQVSTLLTNPTVGSLAVAAEIAIIQRLESDREQPQTV